MNDHSLIADHLVTRPHLLNQLSQAFTHRLTLVVAPAGYGKTTLVSDFKSQVSNLPLVWHTLSEADNDPTHLLAGLIADVRSALPDPTALPAVDETQAALSYPLLLVFRYAAEITHQDWLLILDDYHVITNAAIHQALDTLLNIPTWPVHLVLASRTLPPLIAIARLRVEGRLTELDEQDLRFTYAEAAALFEAGGLHLTAQELDQVTQRAEGWAAALRLICQAAQRKIGADLATLLGRMGDESHLFDYLAGQVLNRQPVEVRRFLCRTALLPYLSVELCNAFLGSADASAILDTLERSHLFVARLAEGPGRRYRYHALFAEFLCRCLEQEEDAPAVREWHRRAAQCLLEGPATAGATDYIAAIPHWLAARDWTQAADALDAVTRLLDWGQFTLMEPWLACFPPEVLAGRPDLLIALGQLRERQCRYPEALAALKQAELLLQSGKTPGDLWMALHRQAVIHFRQGRYLQAIAIGHQELDYLAQGELAQSVSYLYKRGKALELVGGCYLEICDIERGHEYDQQALGLLRLSGDRIGEAMILHAITYNVHMIQGRLSETIELEQRCMRAFEELGSYRVCWSLNTLAMVHWLRGEYDLSRAASERQLQLADVFHDPFQRGYALFQLGHVHRDLGNRETAKAVYEEARQIGDQLNEPYLLFQPRQGLALLALDEGDLREALRLAQTAFEQMHTIGYRHLEGQALTTLGLIMDKRGDASQAGANYHEALRLFQKLGANLDLATVHLYLADLYRREGRGQESQAHLGRSLALSEQYDYDFLFTVKERRRAIPLLVNALAETSEVCQTSEVSRLLGLIGQEAVEPLQSLLETMTQETQPQEQVIHLLGEIGDERTVPVLDRLRRRHPWKAAAQAALQRIAERPAPTLRVSALGGFQVLRGSLPVPAEAWQQRRKARLLLVYLLTQRRPVPRDELLDTLWPDLAPESAGLALNTTFSDLRKLLEPYLGKGMPSRYVTREGDCYSFNTDSDTWYDVRAFEQAARVPAAQKTEPSARSALELYRGDFLPEDPYEDWVIRERERLRSLYLNALTRLLDEHMRQGAWRDGIDVARRILEREPWIEEVWRSLMTCYALLGRRSEALQAYLACERSLRQELDVAPSPETRALYDQIKT